jgi:hypothetical protein
VRRSAFGVTAIAVVLTAGACEGQAAPDTSPRDEGQAVAPPAASCVEQYSPDTLRHRAFAFDGSVASIELRSDPRLQLEQEEDVRIPWVTFSVHRWYRGGSGDEIGVWVEDLNVETSAGTIRAEPGTRLLVAGEPRWGGAPLDDPIAWPCGFTRPYTPEAAAEWEAALGAPALDSV